MVELDSVVVVVMVEALLALSLVIVLLLFFARKKKDKEQIALSALIDKVQDTEKIKVKKMNELISTHCDLEPGVINELLVEVQTSERNLYQQIIKIFLNRDIQLLGDIDLHIENLAEPYCKLLSHVSGGGDEVEEKIQKLTADNERLSEQLTIAMDTMDEISAEYTRVFSGSQTELELENSSKKMFEIFHSAGKQVDEMSVSDESTL